MLMAERQDVRRGERPSWAFLAEVPISFDLPADPELANRLGEAPVRYWELVVEAEEPGVDFATSFVLPVYAPVAAAVSV